MSDPKRATLITVGAPKSAKKNVTKTVRLSINLDESNESKYPELNYKELVIAEERKKVVENGKTPGLDPFSDNDDDIKRVARVFEQKYGNKSTYGKKGRSKHDDYADIGAGYDENDSFIDNTDGYDEMIPPECDTLHGGFYINCGSLEFKTVRENQSAMSDGERSGNRRNKRRISSSSSDEESSESSSESESQDEKDPKAIANGAVDSHKTEHRKKKNKNDKKKAKKVRRTDSSAATSGKQTSDDNGHGDGESADSRTSQSDSLTSKPAPSSENAITSDSSRDVEAKVEVKLPPAVGQVLEELEAAAGRQRARQPHAAPAHLLAAHHHHLVTLERTLSKLGADSRCARAAWARAGRALAAPRAKLLQRAAAAAHAAHAAHQQLHADQQTPAISNIAQSTANTTVTTTVTTTTPQNNKRKLEEIDDLDVSRLTPEETEAKIVETLQRLKVLIEERKPAMMANYNAECDRVKEERRKLQIASATEGGGSRTEAGAVGAAGAAGAGAGAGAGAAGREKRLPKRRFPWCARSRALLWRLARLAGGRQRAADLLAARALPLFPPGFVRMPTLLRQADLSKDIKVSDIKRQRTPSQPPLTLPTPPPQPPQQFTEPIHFPSSLTVTTSLKNSPEKTEVAIGTDDKDRTDVKHKTNPPSVYSSIINSISISKEITVEKPDDRKKDSVILHDKSKEDGVTVYVPPNSIGSITITPVPNSQQKIEKKLVTNSVIISTEKQKEPLIRVKSPAALNEMAKKEKEKQKKLDKSHSIKERRVDSPLQIDTSYQINKKEPTPSPKQKVEEITQKQIENMRVAENNIPRPGLVPVHHSPTFAKPDKRPPEIKKKKDILIVSDVDPLGDVQQEPVAIDDSSSDVEVIEDANAKLLDKSELNRSENKSDTVPSKDKVSARVDTNHKRVDLLKHSSKERVLGKEVRPHDGHPKDKLDEATNEDIDTVMRNLREMEHSQETTKFNSSSYGGVITSAKHEKSSNQNFNSRNALFGEPRSDKDKFAERTSLNKTDGCNAVTG